MMMLLALLSAMLQSAPLSPSAWKERNQPDTPNMPACELGEGVLVMESIKTLPHDGEAAVRRSFGPHGLSDAGGPFNSSDVISSQSAPQTRRFLRAYQVQAYLVVWYEKGGGMAAGPRTVAFMRRGRSTETASDYEMIPGTIFSGDLCAATKAILVGVRIAATAP
jgi:hypothetical protein